MPIGTIVTVPALDDHMPRDIQGTFGAMDLVGEKFAAAQVHADDALIDMNVDEFGNIKENGKTIQRSKLMIDTRMKYLEKMLPRKYGIKKALDISGQLDGEHTVTHMTVEFEGVKDE